MKPVPFLPTLLVAAAVALMIGLGAWQLQRAQWKEALLAEIEQGAAERRSVACAVDAEPEVRSGRSGAGETGYRFLVPCGGLTLDIGWSRDPNALGRVRLDRRFSGTLAPGLPAARPTLVLDEPVPPLQPSGLPRAADIPNNHLAYAVQWFLFAAAAAVIYLVALRRRLPPGGRGPKSGAR